MLMLCLDGLQVITGETNERSHPQFSRGLVNLSGIDGVSGDSFEGPNGGRMVLQASNEYISGMLLNAEVDKSRFTAIQMENIIINE